MPSKTISKRVFGVGIILTGVVILGAALIIGLQFPKFVFDANLESLCILSKGHARYDLWVHDTYREKINKIYYWHIENREEVLHNYAVPQLRERGPYIYREVETKLDVHFSSQQIKYCPWRKQTFDFDLTKSECPTCDEMDNITMVNPIYFQNIAQYGSDYQYAFYKTPSVILEALNIITELHDHELGLNDTVMKLGEITSSYTQTWQEHLNIEPDIECFSFGCWVGMNDSREKGEILERRENTKFTVTEMMGLYEALINPQIFGATLTALTNLTFQKQCEVVVDTPNNVSYHLTLPVQTSNYFNMPNMHWSYHSDNACGLLLCLKTFHKLKTVSTEDNLLNITNLIAQYLCSSRNGSCFQLPMNITLRLAYVAVIADYVLNSIANYVLYKSVIYSEEFVETKPQCQWAVGTCLGQNETDEKPLPNGILAHARTESEALQTSPYELLLSCYDTEMAETNMMWKAYDHKDRSSINQFPNATDEERIIQGRRYNFMPPHLSACASYDIQNIPFGFFYPEFWRYLLYEYDGTTSHRGVKLHRLIFNSSNLDIDDTYIFDQGLQDMSGTYNFTSWVSLPHFLYGTEAIRNMYRTSPDQYYHRPYVDIESMTGEAWRHAWRYQYNIGVKQYYIGIPRTKPLCFNHTDIPIPAYWVDKTSSYTQQGKDDYFDRVGRLMKTSCGGLVGLCVIAGLVMIMGVLAATVTIKSGRVEPLQPEEVSMN